MQIRIMHVVDTLGKGGLENGLVNLVNGLDPTYFEHVVIAIRGLGPNADRLPSDRVPVVCLDNNRNTRIQTPALARTIARFKPHVVHSRNWAAIEAVIAGKWTRSCAIVHSEHGLESDANSKEPWRRICFRRLVYELADRVFSVSDHLRRLHSTRTGFPAHKIGVIHNGVDTKRFRPDPVSRARIREELGLRAGDFCIGCVGNLLPVKDHMTVLKAAAQAAGHLRNWRLLVIGEGPERPNLERFVHGQEWASRVSFLGLSDRVPELLNAFDVYVLPSIAEGISNSLLEAMASGIPVIATDTGGNPEVLINGRSGLLFPVGRYGDLAQHLLRLQDSPHARLSLAREAIRRVREDFSIESMMHKYEHLYQTLALAATGARRAVAGA
jgi:sugar transferase (PEP-CTERM/EpsH1 system associated)